jgi:cytoskeletal protein RodZ
MEPSTTAEPAQTPPVSQPQVKKKLLAQSLWMALLVLVLALSAGAYYWRDRTAKQQQKKQEAEISQLKEKVNQLEQSEQTEAEPKDEAKTNASASAVNENIADAIKSGNTAALEGYMAKSVKVIIAASEGVGDRTPTQAISDLKYLDNATDPWDFDLSADTLNKYASGDYAQYFPASAVVGKSADGKVVSFTFDSSGKITGIFMAASGELL